MHRVRPKVNGIFTSLDVNENGKVEWHEFSALMADRMLRREGRTDLEQAAHLLVGHSMAERSQPQQVYTVAPFVASRARALLTQISLMS